MEELSRFSMCELAIAIRPYTKFALHIIPFLRIVFAKSPGAGDMI
jgi:hypothetical protein